MDLAAFEALSGEVATWSTACFPDNTAYEPFVGMAEEIGEYAHALIKRRQGIRHTPEELDALERDAIGDIVIYMADWKARGGDRGPGDDNAAAAAAETPAEYRVLFTLLRRLAEASRHAGSADPADVSAMLHYLTAACKARGWSLDEIVAETWAKVSRRNWKASPMTAADDASAVA